MSQPPTDGVSRSDDGASAVPGRTAVDPNNVLAIIGTITSQVALITALFYYFGWARTYSLFGYFGVDSNLVGYSTADYVLRSIDVAFPWFICAPLAAIFLFGIHRLILPKLVDAKIGSSPSSNATSNLNGPAPPHASQPGQLTSSTIRRVKALRCWRPKSSPVRRLIHLLELSASAFAATVLIWILFHERAALLDFLPDLLPPLSLIVSVILFGYVAYIRWTYPDATRTKKIPAQPPHPPRAYALTLLTLGLVATIWAISIYGDRLGAKYAAGIAADISSQSEVVVYSTDLIAMYGPGVHVAEITQPGNKYHYQYTGLRLLAHPPDKFLLLPLGWRKGHDSVFLLRDNDSMRIDITAHQ